MGKQVKMHLLSDDVRMLCEFIELHNSVLFTLRSDDVAAVTPVQDPVHESRTMAIWNRALLPKLERSHIAAPEGRSYYRVDESLPTLEFFPSLPCTWNGTPALMQGRIYGSFDLQEEQYIKWYNSLNSWVRRNFVRNPLDLLGGYIGPAAYQWFEKGGVLLPMFNPPSTPEWLSFVENQAGGPGR